MKQLTLGFVIFIFTATVGLPRVWLLAIRDSSTISQEAFLVNVLDRPTPTPKSLRSTASAEFTEVEIPALPEILLAHNDLRSCTKSQKRSWLALIRKSSVYNLERLRFTYGPWEGDAWGGYFPIHYVNEDESEFIFEDNGKLKLGRVETLFTEKDKIVPASNSASRTADSPEANPITMIREDDKPFEKTFVFNNSTYTIESASLIDTKKQEVEALLLESASVTQPIRIYEIDQRVLGDIVWLGDIDRDTRLDMLIRYYPINGDGVSEVLYVSSLAKPGELVEPYATYFPLTSRQCPQAQR